MAKKGQAATRDEATELLRDMLIAQLGVAGVPQQEIRKIVGCGIERVNRIAKHLKASARQPGRKRS